MQIKIDIYDPSTVTAAIRELKKRQTWVKKKTQLFIRRLGEIGVDDADYWYNSNLTQLAGTKDIQTKVKYDFSGTHYTATVIAQGEEVLFVEFGEGIFYPDDYEARDDLAPNSAPVHLHGFMGKGKGANPKGWIYVGNPEPYNPRGTFRPKGRKKIMRTKGSPATPAMYLTKQGLMRQMDKIVWEVFHD